MTGSAQQTQSSSAIEFRDVVYAPQNRADTPILHHISFRIQPGTTTALLGRSGSGKTTLLRTVNGLVMPTSGSVLVRGKCVAKEGVRALRQGIGYVIQESGLFPHMTVERNVAMPMEVAGRLPSERVRRAAELLDLVGVPAAEYAQRMPWQLSGGQRQRAGVARALANDPAVLLMDEPFGALDPLTRAEMQTMLRDLLRRLGKTTLIATHDLQEAVYLADRLVFVEGGRIAADVRASEVANSAVPLVAEYVRAAGRLRLGAQ